MYGCLRLVDPVVTCPYNKNHLIAKSRLQKHIVKCEKKYPENYKVMCPYNATHRLFKNELEEHVVTCPMRMVLETEMYSETKKHGATNFPLPSEISSTIDCTENWDLEYDDNSTILTEEEYSLNNIAGASKITGDANFENNIPESKKLRSPRGFSEAMLRETSEDSCVEDQESVISAMGIGRGKVTWNSDKLKAIGLGRGKPINSNLFN